MTSSPADTLASPRPTLLGIVGNADASLGRPAKPVVTSLVWEAGHVGRVEVQVSCGHHFNLVTFGRAPQIGDPHDCLTCALEAYDREHPPLSEEQLEAIAASLPKCPHCAGDIGKIAFVKRTLHKFEVYVDTRSGRIDAGSEHYDTLEEEPDWIGESQSLTVPDDSGRGARIRARGGQVEVECDKGHAWIESRLAYRTSGDDHIWSILPAPGGEPPNEAA